MPLFDLGGGGAASPTCARKCSGRRCASSTRKGSGEESYAETLVSDPKAREFWDTYVENRQSIALGGAADPTAALMEAARITNRTPAEKAAYAVTLKDSMDAVEDAFVRKQGEHDGVTYYPNSGRWLRGKGLFKSPVARVVTWTGEEKGVVWMSVDQ